MRAEEAAAVYGIVLAGDGVDLAATQARREALRNQRSAEEFVFGPERAAYESRLPPAIQDLVAELLTAYPAATRQFLRDRLYERVASMPSCGASRSPRSGGSSSCCSMTDRRRGEA